MGYYRITALLLKPDDNTVHTDVNTAITTTVVHDMECYYRITILLLKTDVKTAITDINTPITTTLVLYLLYYKKIPSESHRWRRKVTLGEDVMTYKDKRDISQHYF